MKPKKRQPLDFTGIPVEPPVEDVDRPVEAEAEADADAPVTEPDLDLDIAAVPDASAPPIPDRGPLDLDPEPAPEPPPAEVAETPRASARRGFFGGALQVPVRAQERSQDLRTGPASRGRGDAS